MINYLNKVSHQKGISLLEIAVALSILAALLFGVSGALQTADDFELYQENQEYMEGVHRALTTFVQVNRYLPCPDTNGNGRENRNNTNFQCGNDVGKIPFLDLGIEGNDAWGSALKYAVNKRADINVRINDADESASYFNRAVSPFPFFNRNTPPFGSNGGAANLTVCGRDASACAASTSNNNIIEFAAIAVVISFGKNGKETWNAVNTSVLNSLSTAEQENADNDLYYWQARGSTGFEDNDSTITYFDDQLFWITGYDVKYAVLRSGGFFLPEDVPPP